VELRPARTTMKRRKISPSLSFLCVLFLNLFLVLPVSSFRTTTTTTTRHKLSFLKRLTPAQKLSSHSQTPTSFIEMDDLPLNYEGYYDTNQIESQAWQSKASGACASLVTQHCDPCFMAKGDKKFCGSTKDACDKLFCNPLCLRLTWDVEVKATGGPAPFQAEVAKISTQYAIASQFKAHACSKLMGCCEENDALTDWVELRTYGGYFPTPVVPLQFCKEADAAKCSACKSGVAVTVTPKPDVCSKFYEELPPAGKDVALFARASTPGPMQIPKHHGMKKRCEEFIKLLQGKIGSMQSAFTQKVCDCFGCCEPATPEESCFFPVVYNSVKDTLKANAP